MILLARRFRSTLVLPPIHNDSCGFSLNLTIYGSDGLAIYILLLA
jgi:hypothetical protein